MSYWVAEKEIRAEQDRNWSEWYELVREVEVPMNANVISSNLVYMVKKEKEASLSYKY